MHRCLYYLSCVIFPYKIISRTHKNQVSFFRFFSPFTDEARRIGRNKRRREQYAKRNQSLVSSTIIEEEGNQICNQNQAKFCLGTYYVFPSISFVQNSTIISLLLTKFLSYINFYTKEIL